MKSKLNTILMSVFASCTAVLLILLMIYFVATNKNKNNDQPTGNTLDNVSVQPNTANSTEPPAESSRPDESSMVYKQNTPVASENDSSSLQDPSSSSSPTDNSSAPDQPAESRPDTSQTASGETRLFYLFENTPVYIQPIGTPAPVTDFPDVLTQGLYSGRDCAADEHYKEIFYRDRIALVPADSLMVMGSSKILAASMYCQITPDLIGYSGCGPACLYMMQRYSGIRSKIDGVTSYEDLLYYAQLNGYGDQGSLLLLGGGMTADSLIRFARDVYGVELLNIYGYESHTPSDLIKTLLDNDKQVIVLVKLKEGEVVEESDFAHFLLITGYIEGEGSLEFVYANSYTQRDVTFGYPLQTVTAERLNASVSSKFENEPNAILYIR